MIDDAIQDDGSLAFDDKDQDGHELVVDWSPEYSKVYLEGFFSPELLEWLARYVRRERPETHPDT